MSRRIDSRSTEWPARLREMHPLAPPRQLFIEGKSVPCDTTTIAIVGTRRPTAAGVDAAELFAGAFAEAGFVVVSGLALGIDAAAHRAALRKGGHTIAVLGCGLDIPYPPRNVPLKNEIAVRGTLMTEFPGGTEPQPFFFPQRNRIIAGLADGVLVIEGGGKSGAMITARYALDSNREVWALPGSRRNPMAVAPNLLIRVGQAGLVTHPQHVFDDLAPGLAWAEDAQGSTASVDREDVDVLCFLDDVPLLVDHITRRLGLPDGKVALSLARLEIRGLVTRKGAGYQITEAGARARASL